MSSALYLWLDVLTILFPLLLSFDKKVAFVKDWKSVGVGFLLVGLPFIIWDVFFTKHGVWGFNPDYLVGIDIFNLPLEEVLFFLVVPFSCTFIFACCRAYFAKINFSKFNLVFYAALIVYCIILLINGWGGAYTMTTVVCAILIAPILFINRERLHHLPIAFLISVVPFFLVNGVLTGAVTPEPIVWYNDLENSGIRLITIPMDDIIYAWVILSSFMLIFSRMKKTTKRESLIR